MNTGKNNEKLTWCKDSLLVYNTLLFNLYMNPKLKSVYLDFPDGKIKRNLVLKYCNN